MRSKWRVWQRYGGEDSTALLFALDGCTLQRSVSVDVSAGNGDSCGVACAEPAERRSGGRCRQQGGGACGRMLSIPSTALTACNVTCCCFIVILYHQDDSSAAAN